MATKWGVDGQVLLSANQIAEIQGWELNEEVTPIVDTSMGDTQETHIAGSGIKRWTLTADCWWDETDTNGQEACTVGASVTVILRPEGGTTGDANYSGTASVVRRSAAATKDGMITRRIEFLGNGALTQSTVA